MSASITIADKHPWPSCWTTCDEVVASFPVSLGPTDDEGDGAGPSSDGLRKAEARGGPRPARPSEFWSYELEKRTI